MRELGMLQMLLQAAEASAREALNDRPVEDLPPVAAWREVRLGPDVGIARRLIAAKTSTKESTTLIQQFDALRGERP